jgi:hypothetical protein
MAGRPLRLVTGASRGTGGPPDGDAGLAEVERLVGAAGRQDRDRVAVA